jgi:hypothetical protein
MSDFERSEVAGGDDQPTTPVPAVDLAQLTELTQDTEEVIDFESIMAHERVVTPLTRVLLVLLVGAMGFWFGACLKDGGGSGGAGAPGAGAGAGAGPGAGAGGAGAGAGADGGGGLAGVVKLVEDGAVYVTDATGKVTKVVTGPETKVTVTADAKISDLAPLQNVTVQGKANPDGSFTATAISEAPPAPAPGAGGG